jgi:hypothetical protein
MVLNALYVCLLYSRFIENHPILILEDGPLISKVVLSQEPRLYLGKLILCQTNHGDPPCSRGGVDMLGGDGTDSST